MMVGKCVVWSWVNSVLIALWVLLFLVAIVTSQENQRSRSQAIMVVQYEH
jgi:uncharacterized membrane protein